MQEPVVQENGTGQDFESVYQRLEETVERLENGGLSLEESIQLYEAGMRLARRCKQMLDAAELRIGELNEEFAAEGLEAAIAGEEAY